MMKIKGDDYYRDKDRNPGCLDRIWLAFLGGTIFALVAWIVWETVV